jgi:hypothetical protein
MTPTNELERSCKKAKWLHLGKSLCHRVTEKWENFWIHSLVSRVTGLLPDFLRIFAQWSMVYFEIFLIIEVAQHFWAHITYNSW